MFLPAYGKKTVPSFGNKPPGCAIPEWDGTHLSKADEQVRGGKGRGGKQKQARKI